MLTITQRPASSKTCARRPGRPSPGERLPSVRELMARHRASPVTVQRAIAALAAEGVLEPRPGPRHLRGGARAGAGAARPLVAGRGPRRGRASRPTRCTSCWPSPHRARSRCPAAICRSSCSRSTLVGAALARAARRPGAWERGPVEGREELRAWFARQAGGSLRAHDVVVCSGGQPALATAFRALAAPGDPVLVEAPTYLGRHRRGARGRAARRPRPQRRRRRAPRPARPGLRAHPERAWSTASRSTPTPTAPCSRPTAGRGARRRRRRGRLPARGRLGARPEREADPPPPLAADDPDGHVVYVRSLTKSAAPGLRVAGIGARGAAGARLRAARIVDDFFVSGPLQEAALEVVSAPGWRRHRRRLRAALRERRDALAAALQRHCRRSRRPRSPAAACTCGWRCPKAPTTSRWRRRGGRGRRRLPRAARGSRPIRRGRSCA